MNAIQARRILTLAFLAIAALSSAHAQMSDVQKFQIHMTDPTYTGLPIWIYAESSFPLEIHYPYGEDPEDFGPNRLEVKRENQLLEKVPFKPWVGRGGLSERADDRNGCGAVRLARFSSTAVNPRPKEGLV
ncbi:MAG: hypothetical protein DMG42_37100 [Acidobacteria bacterium]|nr:MAG: hypothetical protein DMG42_37100 [Acidobacteriota bacterium]